MHLASGNNKPLHIVWGVRDLRMGVESPDRNLQRLECNPRMHRSMKR